MLFDCPHCRNKIRIVRDPKSGGTMTCPKCGQDSASWDTETATLRVAPKTVGKYELLNRLGQGQFGEVWSARDPDLDRLIAIKIPRNEDLDAFDVERFFREARAAAQLQHNNIVKLIEFGEDPIYIASELIDGASLADRLASGWKPTWRETATLCMKLAKALQHAHERGVVHRDMKPANVLTDKEMEPKLSDFGLAKRDGGEVTMTFDGQILGTPAYMPPEQARGDGHNADARSDIYSLGVVLFEMLTGVRPFQGGTQVLIQQILHQDPRPLRKINRDIPRDLETVCLKCLEKAPEQRYQTAQLLAEELQRVLSGEPILARPISRIARWGRWANRNRRMAALLGAVVLLVVSLVMIWLDNQHQRALSQPVQYTVALKTYPPATRVTAVPVDPKTGEPDTTSFITGTLDATQFVFAKVMPGEYQLMIQSEGHHTLEVHRTIPASTSQFSGLFPQEAWKSDRDGEVRVAPIYLLDSRHKPIVTMKQVPGGPLNLTPPPPTKTNQKLLKQYPPRSPGGAITVKPFEMADHELTKGEAKQIVERYCEMITPQDPDWDSTPDKCLETLETLGIANLPDSERDTPLTSVTHDEAMLLAEMAGMRLMTEAEYLFAATNGGTTRYPWGDDATLITGWSTNAQPYDVTLNYGGIHGLYSGIAEWTASWPIKLPGEPQIPIPADLLLSRIVRGVHGNFIYRETMSDADAKIGPRFRFAHLRTSKDQRIGIRLCRTSELE